MTQEKLTEYVVTLLKAQIKNRARCDTIELMLAALVKQSGADESVFLEALQRGTTERARTILLELEQSDPALAALLAGQEFQEPGLFDGE